MSNSLFAFLRKDDVPDRARWQEAIDASGYSLELGPDLRPFEASGFLPCQLLGRDAGFEIAYGTAQELAGDAWREVAPEHADHCVTFTWGSGMTEGASAAIAAYALAARFGATVSYECEEPQSLEAQAAEIEEFLTEIRG